jgi:hypothetical protein
MGTYQIIIDWFKKKSNIGDSFEENSLITPGCSYIEGDFDLKELAKVLDETK